jgi:CheY-like chemotaxis protein
MTGILSHTGDDVGETKPSDRERIRMSHLLRILLVDDSVMIRKTISRALISEGHDVEVAQHGADCLKMLEASSTPFDLILMDLQMPVMDGIEATKRIRSMEKLAVIVPEDVEGMSALPPPSPRRIKIIGISANTVGEARDDCMACGMDGFIEKPLKMTTLKEYYLNL